jgi:DNA-binding NarL/FixJ family response regulator
MRMGNKDPIRVVIADDQAIVRSGLGAFVMAYDELQLVGEAKDGEEAIELCELLQPDVVLMDLKMPHMDGLAATRVISERWPHIHVLVLTSFKDKDMVQGALDAGATGYLLKDLSALELVEAILQVYEGRRLIAPAATEALAQAELLGQFDEQARTLGNDLNHLKELLADFLPKIFTNCYIQVRLFPNQDIYSYPSPLPKPIPEPAWRWLGAADEAAVFTVGEQYPWGGRHAPGTDLILAPVPSLRGGQMLAGVGITCKNELSDHDEILDMLNQLVRILSHTIEPPQGHDQQDTQQRATQELEMAWRIQSGILPAGAPSIRGWDVAARLVPARETSGDFFDFIPLGNDRWAIVIADVTDKGLGAAVFMALCSTLIRTYAGRYPTLPAIAMSAVNERILSDTRGSLFVTAFYAVLEPDIGRLRYVNAGHNPPFLLSTLKSKRVDRLSRTGIPLGISQDVSWGQKIAKFSQGDVLVLFTDGITEAQNPQGTFFGDQRLVEVIRSNTGRSAQNILQSVLDAVQSFTGGTPQEDDIALIVMSRQS